MERGVPKPQDVHGPNPGEPGYEEIKRQINQSAEDLYIGTREEIDRARAKVESEGRAPTVADAIRLHKEVAITESALRDFLLEVAPGWAEKFSALPPGAAEIDQDNDKIIYYKDASGHLARTLVNERLIDECQNPPRKNVIDELEALGFEFSGGWLFGNAPASKIESVYLDHKAKKQREIKKREFSF